MTSELSTSGISYTSLDFKFICVFLQINEIYIGFILLPQSEKLRYDKGSMVLGGMESSIYDRKKSVNFHVN